MSSPPTKPSFLQRIMGVRAATEEKENKQVKGLVTCDRCEEFVVEDDMHKRRRRGKTKIGKYCKECGKKGCRPPTPFNEE